MDGNLDVWPVHQRSEVWRDRTLLFASKYFQSYFNFLICAFIILIKINVINYMYPWPRDMILLISPKEMIKYSLKNIFSLLQTASVQSSRELSEQMTGRMDWETIRIYWVRFPQALVKKKNQFKKLQEIIQLIYKKIAA